MMLGYSLLADGGCRLADGTHGVEDVDFTKNPGDSGHSRQACEDFCTSAATCLAFEWDGGPPKCESWLVMPEFGEPKPMHTCMLKLRELPPPPSLPPPSAPDSRLTIGLGVGGGGAVLAVLLLVVACVTRARRTKHRHHAASDADKLPSMRELRGTARATAIASG